MNIQDAINNPSDHFPDPLAVCHAPGLTQKDKIKILRHWEYDLRELEVAEEENMCGGPTIGLDLILEALHCVEAEIDLEHGSPTKQGGE